MSVLVGDVTSALGDAFPWSWAEPWDAVGLRVGDVSAEVRGVLVTLDADEGAVERCVEAGANVLLAHHPPSLAQHSVLTADGASRTLFKAAAEGVAIIVCHTNLDRAPAGAKVLLDAIGAGPGAPLERSTMDAVLLTTYSPAESADAVRAALAAAGAGRVGEYESCSFSAGGRGRFTARPTAEPTAGSGEPAEAEEERIEVLFSSEIESTVLSALRDAHPYEEPVAVLQRVTVDRGVARLGRVADLDTGTSLAGFVDLVSRVFDCTPTVWGDPDSKVDRVASGTGSGSSLLSAALAAKADVMLTGEVRYHDALDAISHGMAVIEAGHDVTEWPLVEVLAEAVRTTPGLDTSAVIVEQPRRSWWTP